MSELREKVARAIADVEYPRLPPRAEHYEMADAAIALALEEAAVVADAEGRKNNGNDGWDSGWCVACETIAAAIRAMKGKPPTG